MSIVVGLFVVLVSLGLGAAVAVAVIRRTARAGGAAPEAGAGSLSADRVSFSGSLDVIARDLGVLLGDGAGLTLLAVYAARGAAGEASTGAMPALLRAREGGSVQELPEEAPAALLGQLPGPALVSRGEIASGIGAAAVGPADPSSLVAAVPWRGPFGWQGLVVARVAREDPGRAFAALDPAVAGIGERLGVMCELQRAAREAHEAAGARLAEVEAHAEELERKYARVKAAYATGPLDPAAVIAAPPPPDPVIAFVDEPAPGPLIPLLPEPARGAEAGPRPATRVAAAELRVAELLVAPRSEADVARAAVSLLFEGLGADRCYAVEMGALRARAVEHERRREGAASARGLDLGQAFVEAVRRNARDEFGAVLLTGDRAAEMLTAEARERLRPAAQLAVPVVERGRTVAVFVAEREGAAGGWSDEEVAFAERVVARAAAARAVLERFESLALQVGHAREEQERMEGALRQLQAVVSALPDALVGVDSDGKITYANRAAGRLLGVAEFELMGRWLAEVGADLGGTAETWERVLAAPSAERYTASLESAGGKTIVDVTVVPSRVPGVFDRLVTLSERKVGAV